MQLLILVQLSVMQSGSTDIRRRMARSCESRPENAYRINFVRIIFTVARSTPWELQEHDVAAFNVT